MLAAGDRAPVLVAYGTAPRAAAEARFVGLDERFFLRVRLHLRCAPAAKLAAARVAIASGAMRTAGKAGDEAAWPAYSPAMRVPARGRRPAEAP